MESKGRLLVIVYSLDNNHPIFGHQARVASEIARVRPNSHFLSIYSVGDQKFGELLGVGDHRFKSADWREGSLILNITKFWITFLITFVKVRPSVVFSHMVDTHAAMIAPLLFLLRTTHILWYAHKSRSVPLKICSIFCDLILTSTRNSCPINSSKVKEIGQSIDPRQFSPRPDIVKIERAIHVGRLDESKRIRYVAQEIDKALKKNLINDMSFFGDFSSRAESINLSATFDQLSVKYSWFTDSLKGPVNRSELPGILKSYDVFVHGFLGSLDKVLIESTFAKIPVATENPEYLNEFGLWPGCPLNATIFEQLEAISKLSDVALQKILADRYYFALKNHSLDSWMEKFLFYVDNSRQKL